MRVSELSRAAVAVGSLITPALATSSSFSSQRSACPQTCSTLGNETSNWTVYSWADRLKACNETMLLNFNLYNTLERPRVKISACVADSDTSIATRDLGSTNSTGGTTTTTVEILPVGSGDSASTANIVDAAAQLQSFIASGPTADRTIRFAYSGGAVVGIYSGSEIDSTSTSSLLQSLSDRVSAGQIADTTVMQVCDNRTANGVLGVIADTTESALSTVQQVVASWSNATCADFGSSAEATTSEITLVTHQRTVSSKLKPRVAAHGRVVLPRDTECSTIQVVSGDSCSSLASSCGITGTEFTEYNTDDDLCSTLAIGQYVCCSEGTLPDYSPDNYANGTCYTYLVESGDTCSQIAATYSITVDDIEDWNADTWGWTGCDDLMADENICLSDGDPPMPASISNAECGPQVEGTTAPSDMSTLADLNPCPLNACCDIWGQCGITEEFCTISNSTTGAPGTAADGENGCISNCGTEIVNNDSGPDSVMKVGYYEAFSLDRSCLTMEVNQIPDGYTHIHYAFTNISSDYSIGAGGHDDAFADFVDATDYKRIASFGGWSFSTDADTYTIFREGTAEANRATLVSNVVAFVDQYGLDGVDFDWEYPGEPDIDGIPAGGDDEGDNYLAFLTDLKAALPSDVTLSIAAPASYWYLKQFPIADISEVVDYIIYMTYDLHGQWDYGNEYSQPGCDDGNCLRSHVNLTETYTALAMVTKAGVQSTKIVVGVASYGRSFGMTDSECYTAECTYTGPDSGASPGRCTDTAGYISNAEINEIIANSSESVLSFTDGNSESDILVYDGNWVAYMSDDTKETRITYYTSLNFAGTTDWAIDLQTFDVSSSSDDDDDDDDGTGIVSHQVGGETWCEANADVASGTGDAYATAVFALEKAACSRTATYTETSLPFQTMSCDSTAVTDSDQDQADRWDDVYATTAFEMVLVDYFYEQDSTSLTFPEYVSDWFDGPDGMNCGKTAANVGCESMVECDDVKWPAGAFILNSFVTLHGIIYNAYSALYNAESDMQTSIGTFSTTFAEQEDVAGEIEIFNEMLGTIFGLVAGPMWESALKALPSIAEAGSDALDVAKETVNGLVNYGIEQMDSTQDAWELAAEAENKISEYMGQLVKSTAQALSDTNEWIFNGSETSVANLWRVIDEGQMMEDTSTTSDLEMQQYMEQAMYATLMPYAWSLSNEALHPFVMDTGYDCSDTYPKYFHDYISEDTANSMAVCIDDSLYYLVDAVACNTDCSGVHGVGSTVCSPTKFSAPVGIDTLDGSNWGGITITNLVTSAVNGYKGNDNANGWTYLDPTTDSGMQAIWDYGIEAGGVVNLPVCDMATAFNNWVDCDVDADNYPCQ